MKFEKLFSHTFKALREQINEAAIQRQVDFMLPSMPMVEACRADEFDFFQPWIELGRLSVEQMHHAAERYFLGKTKSGASIFWMIDDRHRPLDAMIDPETWMSRLLKKRETILRAWRPGQCLFGLHLLCHTESTESTEKNSHTDLTDPTDPAERNCPAEMAEMTERISHTESTESTERNSHTDLKDLTDPAERNCPAERTEMTERISHTESTESTESTERNSHTDLKDLTDSKSPAENNSPAEMTEMTESPSDGAARSKISAISAISAGPYKKSVGQLRPIHLVEEPISAVILSEVYPNSIWLSTVPNACFTIDLLEPLRGRTIKVYPHTDATLSNYLAWLDLADMARQTYHLDITVSRTLEDAVSPSQKSREIDILQYLYELYSFNRKVP